MKVLVTGASGFAGHAMVPALLSAGWQVRASSRRPPVLPAGSDFAAADLCKASDCERLTEGVEAIVHLAARVHVMHETAHDPLAEFRRLNVQATEQLAKAAAKQGVRHFVFASSIKVNGEASSGQAFTERDKPCPADPYSVSKWEAEQALREQAGVSNLSLTVFRPPLMYGAGVKGNFARLMRCVRQGWPLPLASVKNRRSLLYIGNFCSAVVAALAEPAPAARVYLLSDGEDVSLAELILRMGRALGRPARLFPFPLSVLRAGAVLTGLQAEWQRLAESLVIDASCARRELHWRPPYSLDQGLLLTAQACHSSP